MFEMMVRIRDVSLLSFRRCSHVHHNIDVALMRVFVSSAFFAICHLLPLRPACEVPGRAQAMFVFPSSVTIIGRDSFPRDDYIMHDDELRLSMHTTPISIVTLSSTPATTFD
jgi:hypothetical protein